MVLRDLIGDSIDLAIMKYTITVDIIVVTPLDFHEKSRRLADALVPPTPVFTRVRDRKPNYSS